MMNITFLQKPPETTDYAAVYEALFPTCARWVRSMNGSLDDAEDIFQDALIIYMEKADDEVVLTKSREAYLVGIMKHLWIRKFSKDKALVTLSDVEKMISIPDDFYPSINENRLLNFLESAGRNCLELLSAFYYEKLSMTVISKKMGYRTEHSVTVQKYKCIEKLRTSVKQKSLSYEDFTE